MKKRGKPKLITRLQPSQVDDIYGGATDQWTTEVLDDDNVQGYKDAEAVLADTVFYVGHRGGRIFLACSWAGGETPSSDDMYYDPDDGWQPV